MGPKPRHNRTVGNLREWRSPSRNAVDIPAVAESRTLQIGIQMSLSPVVSLRIGTEEASMCQLSVSHHKRSLFG